MCGIAASRLLYGKQHQQTGRVSVARADVSSSASLGGRPPEAVVQRVAGAAYGADRVGFAAAIESLAEPPDMNIHSALVDINLGAPNTVEQLLAREHPAGPLHEEFEQPIFGRAEINLAAGARYPFLLAVEFDVTVAQHVGNALRRGAAQQSTHASDEL